jgi:hypothetical protein
VPETKQVPLEDIDRLFGGTSHREGGEALAEAAQTDEKHAAESELNDNKAPILEHIEYRDDSYGRKPPFAQRQ